MCLWKDVQNFYISIKYHTLTEQYASNNHCIFRKWQKNLALFFVITAEILQNAKAERICHYTSVPITACNFSLVSRISLLSMFNSIFKQPNNNLS